MNEKTISEARALEARQRHAIWQDKARSAQELAMKEKLSNVEIARRMGLSVSSVRALLIEKLDRPL
jgi:DNA-directed RNA polymerase specialized sigma24 family protein